MEVTRMRIALGSDHGGFEYKEIIKERLINAGYEIVDIGVLSNQAVDYPDIAVEVSNTVVAGDADCGILFCGTGIGMSIAANKVKGIRAALCTDTFSARMAKQHNNANIITLGARTLGIELAYEIITAYLSEEFLGDRHLRRVNKIDAIC
jgi:ribose 5-phosphate isomerase B